jgi:hypothetical protein
MAIDRAGLVLRKVALIGETVAETRLNDGLAKKLIAAQTLIGNSIALLRINWLYLVGTRRPKRTIYTQLSG